MQLNLKRPIIFFDLETTGINIATDRIVEISYIKVMPDGTETERTYRVNPTVPIPAQATAVHHITDADVADSPTFRELAPSLIEEFADCDIAGFNSNKFDVPLLIKEFNRVGMQFDLEGRRFVDVQTIFHKMEQRTLAAAYKFYCQKELVDAHSALADTRATYEVLKAQLDKYPHTDKFANDVETLSNFSAQNRNIDIAGKFIRNSEGEAVFNFGQHKGRPVAEVLKSQPGYYEWMMKGDFPQNTKDVITTLRHRLLK